MILTLLIGLVLAGVAVTLLSRAFMASRMRAADTLGQINQEGFSGRPGMSEVGGIRGFFDETAASVGSFLLNRLHLFDPDALRKSLVAAGMYEWTPRMLMGYQAMFTIVLPALWLWFA